MTAQTGPDPNAPPMLLALAEQLRVWFPELEGRAVAVSEAEITKENMPTLPVAMCALAYDNARDEHRTRKPAEVIEDIFIEFWMPVERYRRKDGSELPFWKYYDHTALRRRLVGHLKPWRSPQEFGTFAYVGLNVDATEFAVVLAFRFRHHFLLCADVPDVQPACEPPLRFRADIGRAPWPPEAGS